MNVLDRIRAQLARVDAQEMRTTLDSEFEPDTGELVKLELEGAYWHLLPEDFSALLEELPDGAGTERVRTALESASIRVWHGPSPTDSRDEG